jgi:flagellar FliJ protein
VASPQAIHRIREIQTHEFRGEIKQLRSIISDFERLAENLEFEIHDEEQRTKISDPSHFAYSNLAKANIKRRDNLKVSIEQFNAQLTANEQILSNALKESQKLTIR